VSGITGSSKVQAHEMTGKMILYLLVFCSEFSTQYFETIHTLDDIEDEGEEEANRNTKKRNTALHKGGSRQLLNSNRVADYIWAIEEVLLTTEYIKHDLTLEDLDKFCNYTPRSMYRLKKCMNRLTGMGMNFLKFHLWSHRPLNIQHLGNPQSYDTQTLEKSHGQTSKRTAKGTNRHADTLDEQSSQRNWENLVIDRSFMSRDVYCDYIKDTTMEENKKEHAFHDVDGKIVKEEEDDTGGEPIEFGFYEASGFSMVLHQKPRRLKFSGNNKKRRPSDEVQWHDKQLQSQVTAFIAEKVLPKISSNENVHFFNHISRIGENVLYHADPIRANHRGKGHGWHDWATVTLQGRAFHGLHRESAVHIMSIIEIVDKNLTPCDEDLMKIDCPGLYVVGHVLKSGIRYNQKRMVTIEEDEGDNNEEDDQVHHKKRRGGRTTVPKSNKRRRSQELSEDETNSTEEFDRGHPQSRMVMKGHKYGSVGRGGIFVPALCVLPVSWITGPIIAVPNLVLSSKSGKKEHLKITEMADGSYLFINGRDKWYSAMKKWIENPV
jgi:hypothetical protein